MENNDAEETKPTGSGNELVVRVSAARLQPKLDYQWVNLGFARQYEALQLAIAEPLRRQQQEILRATRAITAASDLARSFQVSTRGIFDKVNFGVTAIDWALPALAGLPQITLVTSRIADLVKPQITALQSQLRWNLDLWQKLARQTWDVAGLVGRWALTAAWRAREAALHGRTYEVDEFIEDYLELSVTEWRREAVVSVLLSDDWLDEDVVGSSPPVIVGIKKLVIDETKNHKLLGQTQIAGRKLDSLDRTIVLPGGTKVAFGDVVPARSGGGQYFDFDGRLQQLLERLSPDQRRIVLAYSEDIGSWGDAALAAGATPEAGDAVRKKCKRFAARQQAIATAMAR